MRRLGLFGVQELCSKHGASGARQAGGVLLWSRRVGGVGMWASPKDLSTCPCQPPLVHIARTGLFISFARTPPAQGARSAPRFITTTL